MPDSDDQRPVALRVVGEDLLGEDVARDQPTDDLRPDDRRHRPRGGVQLDAAHPQQAADAGHRVLPTGDGEVPGEQPHELLQIADQRRVAVHLHAEILERSDARRRRDAPRGRPHQRLVDAADLAVPGDRHLTQRGQHVLDTGGVPRQPCTIDEPLVDEHGSHRRDEPRIATGPHPQVEVGHRRGLGDPWIDHDHRPVRVGGDRLQGGAGVRDAVGDPRVLAHEQRHLAVLEVAAQRNAEHLAHDQHLAGLLLRDGVRLEPGTERGERRRAIDATQVVSLPAAAVVDDRLTSVGIPHGGQPLGHLADRRVPVDLLVRPVRPPAQRAQQPLTAPVLVVVEAQRLLAGVALRRRMGLVASDPFEGPAVAAETDLHPAVALTQDARRLMPLGHGRSPVASSSVVLSGSIAGICSTHPVWIP